MGVNLPRPLLARAPASRDIASWLAAIDALPLINVARAAEKLSVLLDNLRQQPLAAASYLGVLEAMREPLAFIQRERASQFVGKPLALSDGEEAAFAAVVTLWQQATQAYLHAASQGGQTTQALALICQRCLQYSGARLRQHFEARRAPARGLWSEINGYYQTAQEWGIAEVPVADASNQGVTASCSSTYFGLLLLDLMDPYRCLARELALLQQWLPQLAGLLRLSAPPTDGAAPAFAVDLMRDHGLRPYASYAAGESLLYLDTAVLAAHVEETLARLKRGDHPADLGLGACPPASAGRLLRHIRRHLGLHPRRFVRACAGGTLRLCCGFAAAHGAISGGEQVPSRPALLTHKELDRLSTFREQTQAIEPVRPSQMERSAERWEICDQSLSGFHLARKAAGNRIGPATLLAIRAPASEHYRLAVAVWTKFEADGRIHAGVRLLPGRPRALSVRAAEPSSGRPAHAMRAFLLPAVPALGQGASLVLPLGCFHAEQILEIKAESSFIVKLGRRLARGADFEQMSFSEAAA